MTTTPRKIPFEIYAIDPAGLNVGTYGGSSDPITATGVTLFPGASITVTDEIHALSRDRNGDSWMDLSEDEQRARWGKVRFGVGEIPDHVLKTVAAERRRRLMAERDNLKFTNPRLAKSSAASQRLAELDAAIAGES